MCTFLCALMCSVWLRQQLQVQEAALFLRRICLTDVSMSALLAKNMRTAWESPTVVPRAAFSPTPWSHSLPHAGVGWNYTAQLERRSHSVSVLCMVLPHRSALQQGLFVRDCLLHAR